MGVSHYLGGIEIVPPPSLLCSYIPVLMAQAKIYWEIEKYQNVEKIFRKSVEFCSEHNTWRLNVAHVLFMQVHVHACTYMHLSL